MLFQCCYNPVQEALVTENPETEFSANVTLEENHQEDTETCSGEHLNVIYTVY